MCWRDRDQRSWAGRGGGIAAGGVRTRVWALQHNTVLRADHAEEDIKTNTVIPQNKKGLCTFKVVCISKN